MGRICFVEAYGSEYYPDCGLSFHRFPKDPNVREIWINIIPMSSTRKLTDASVVCIKHFKAQDFVACLSRPVLKCDAVPSVFLLGRKPGRGKYTGFGKHLKSPCIICQRSTNRVGGRSIRRSYLLTPAYVQENNFILEYIEHIDNSIEFAESDRICRPCVQRGSYWKNVQQDSGDSDVADTLQHDSDQQNFQETDAEVAPSSLETGTSSQWFTNIRTAEFTKTIPYLTVSSGRVMDGTHEEDQRILNKQALKITLARIRANPQLYIGIPTNCYHLIELLHKQTHISTTHILLCLKKVKLDTHFDELADQFGIMADEAQDIFIQSIPILAKKLESFIVNMDSDEDVQTKLLIPFRAEHHNTNSVIDSLELKVQPQTAKSKNLTQTDRGNTVKYLISCTPNGLINYVSPGYGGTHSDERLLETTKYLERFQPGACIIVNNGFKNAEPMLKQKGLKLLRPQAHKRSQTFHKVTQHEGLSEPYSKNEDNWILNNIERVVQRVRDYTMIRDHSVISSELVRVLDEAVVISCALINLQSFVIN